MTASALAYLAPVVSFPARRRAPWTLRVSGTETTSATELTEDDLAETLARLLRDEQVETIAVARRTREVHARLMSEVLVHGELRVDVGSREVNAGGEHVSLTRRELDFLIFLLRNPDRALTREELLVHVWAGAETGVRTVDIHVRRLRAKLAHVPFPLETLIGVGYRFTTRPASLASKAR